MILSKKEIKEIIKYLNNSVLKPYLIHVEFEVMNILTQLEMDKLIRKIYAYKGFNFKYLIETTNKFLYRIRNLIKAMEF